MVAASRILVVGSINIDLYRRLDDNSAATFRCINTPIPLTSVKGMTLPAKSFVSMISTQVKDHQHLVNAEAFVLSMDGPFEQKTGGKGANAAAAAGQTSSCEFIGNFGGASNNAALLSDLATYGDVDVSRCNNLPGVPTGTAYILRYSDNDNGIVLIGGANQLWPTADELLHGNEGMRLRSAIDDCVAVMLQREIPDYVNVVIAKLAYTKGLPVCMDVGGTDAPLDPELIPYLSVICPNESELTFISGIETHDEIGAVQGDLVRKAVKALKAQCNALGNTNIEILVTLGSGGSVYFGVDWICDNPTTSEICMGCYKLSTLDCKPIDTTGAGDCYRGSYVAARYGQGKTVLEAMRWAACASSLACEIDGAMPSMPTREMIIARLQEKLAFEGGLDFVGV
jgi:ribokinase